MKVGNLRGREFRAKVAIVIVLKVKRKRQYGPNESTSDVLLTKPKISNLLRNDDSTAACPMLRAKRQQIPIQEPSEPCVPVVTLSSSTWQSERLGRRRIISSRTVPQLHATRQRSVRGVACCVEDCVATRLTGRVRHSEHRQGR